VAATLVTYPKGRVDVLVCGRGIPCCFLRLWSGGIDSVSAVVDLETNDSRKLTMQETQCKDLDTLDVIEDARSKKKTFPLIIQNSLISVIFNDGIRTMSAFFHLKLIHKP
jgi:hypothetical protein